MNKLASHSGNFAVTPDWNDVRYAVVLARCGSLAAAARQLTVDQTTVARRLRVLETCMGTPLFERLKGLMTPTPAGYALIECGQRMEQEMAALSHLAADSQTTVQGVIRITAVDALVSHYLARHLAELRGLYPDLAVELIGSSRRLDLSRREADIAIRLARPVEGDFVVRCLGQLARVSFRCNSLDALAIAVADGLGLGILPRFIGERQAAIRCLSGPAPVLSREMWLVVPRELRDIPRIRAVSDWLVQRFQADEAVFA